MTPYRYYFALLTKREKAAYLAMESALADMKSEFSVPRLEFSRISEIHTMLRLDLPLLIPSDRLTLSKLEGADSVRVKPHYTMTKKEYAATLQALSKRLSRIMSKAEGDHFRKEKFFHDFLVTGVKYDKLKKQYSHEVTGPLCHGVGVCEGISKSFKLMCDAVGIECICVIGDGVPLGAASGKKWEKHMWNMVKLSDEWTCVDVTFDSSLSDDSAIRYDYFNVTDDVMARSHSSVMFKVPAARKRMINSENKNFRG